MDAIVIAGSVRPAQGCLWLSVETSPLLGLEANCPVYECIMGLRLVSHFDIFAQESRDEERKEMDEERTGCC